MNETRRRIIVAKPNTTSTVPLMHWNWKWFRAAAFVALLALNAGCGGIHAQKSISILDLLLPGITKNDSSAGQDERDGGGPIRPKLAAK